ncbi:MAG: serine hydrolase [Phycisphaeraceae bacterium]|nr:serine hydrolase [Phycisphaeraceae bacterium]MBX3406982.1 serine hydrolase [Phycisphaeraceae bacterium]
MNPMHRTLLRRGVWAVVVASFALSAATRAQPAAPPRADAPTGAQVEGETWQKRGDAAADYSARFAGRAVLITHRGRVVYERYDGGWTASRPHMLASGTKSFTGVLAMFAVQDGLLSLDERACDTLDEWREDPRKSKITVRMLLNLSSGLDPAEDTIGSAGALRLRGGRLLRGDGPRVDDKFAAAIAVEATGEPGARFVYGPSHFYAFGALLQRKLEARREDDPTFPATVRAYLDARIFKPLKIDVAFLGQDAQGNPNLPGGCFLAAREWAKFGEFVRLNGAIAAPTEHDPGAKRQLLRPELLAQCFEPSKANPAYGLTWWLPGNAAAAGGDAGEADLPLRDRLRQRALRAEASAKIKDSAGNDVRVWMAAGLGKQRLYVLPDHDLVIVRFAENGAEGRGFRDAEFLGRVLGVE